MKFIYLKGNVFSVLIKGLHLATYLLVVHFVGAAVYGAAVTQVYFDTGGFLIARSNGAILTGGSPTIDHDGTVVQLGYHPEGSVYFSDWIPLTGEGSANSAFAQSTIGDSFLYGGNNGEFYDGWLFTVGSAETGQNFPMDGTPLAVRFFDGMNVAHSGAYQEVSNSLWLWKAPLEQPDVPVVSMSLEDAGTKMLFNRNLPADGKIRTDVGILVPEPVSIVFLATGCVTLIGRRWQRRYRRCPR